MSGTTSDNQTPTNISNELPATAIQLLDVAEELFAARGFDAVGIREITDAADVNISSIKYHFGSKRGLYLATVKRAMQRSHADDAWQHLLPKPINVGAAIVALSKFVNAFLDVLLMPQDSRCPGCFILREAAQPSEAASDVAAHVLQPKNDSLHQLIRVLRPDDNAHEIELHGRSILGQILHYHMARPLVERMTIGSLDDPQVRRTVGMHITRFSLAALGVAPHCIDEHLDSHAHSFDG